jgi:hypothetical protein
MKHDNQQYQKLLLWHIISLFFARCLLLYRNIILAFLCIISTIRKFLRHEMKFFSLPSLLAQKRKEIKTDEGCW